MRDVVGVERGTGLAREDQTVVMPRLTDCDALLGQPGPMLPQEIDELRG